MTKVVLLEQLKEFTEEHTRDLLLPVQAREEDEAPPPDCAPAVYVPRLPELYSYKRKAPFITHEIVTGKDKWDPIRRSPAPDSSAVVRTCFCVYHPNEMEGGLALLNLMERLRIALLEQGVIGRQFRLDVEAGVETLVYPTVMYENTVSPFYSGEMLTTWKLPPVERKVPYGKEGYSNIRKSGPGPDCGIGAGAVHGFYEAKTDGRKP